MPGREGLLGEVRRGLLSVLVLRILSERGDTHGYAIRMIVSSVTGWMPPESTLYDVLRRLERLGLAESYWARGRGSGGLRKYYRITERGRRALEEAVEETCRLARGLGCGGVMGG